MISTYMHVCMFAAAFFISVQALDTRLMSLFGTVWCGPVDCVDGVCRCWHQASDLWHCRTCVGASTPCHPKPPRGAPLCHVLATAAALAVLVGISCFSPFAAVYYCGCYRRRRHIYVRTVVLKAGRDSRSYGTVYVMAVVAWCWDCCTGLP
jgi:hypothetical protein